MAKRRGHGEGSIHERADGRWAGVVELGWENGKRRRKYCYGKTRREVAEKMTRLLATQQQGLSPTDERQRVGAYLTWWATEVMPTQVRPSTRVRHQCIVRLHLVPALGRHTMARLSPAHVQQLLAAKTAEGLSPRTVGYVHAVLHHALEQAFRWGMVPRNVASLVKPPRAERSEVVPLSPDQARRLLKTAEGDRLYALYAVALAVGLRQGEALGLHWEDVDLDEGTLRVRVALQRIAGRLEFVEPKTARSRRTVVLPAHSVDVLRAHRRQQAQERLAAGSAWHDDGLVFATTIGTPLDARNVTRQFRAMCARADVGQPRFHDLRHTCASLLLAQNVHPRVVMDVLGHSQISLTLDTYSHVMPALQKSAADGMDAMLGSSAS